MEKKKVLISTTVLAIVVIILIILFSKFRKNEAENLKSIHKEETNSSIVEAETSVLPKESDEENDESTEDKKPSWKPAYDYETKEESIAKNVILLYPEIKDMEDLELQDKINASIKNNLTSYINLYFSENNIDKDSVSLALKPEIKNLDKSRIVIIYKGELRDKDKTTRLALSNTVNLRDASSLSLKDYLDTRTLASYVLDPSCIFEDSNIVSDVNLKELLSQKDSAYYEELFNNADLPIKDGKLPLSFSYEQSGNIFFTIPLPNEFGDYAVLRYEPHTK